MTNEDKLTKQYKFNNILYFSFITLRFWPLVFVILMLTPLTVMILRELSLWYWVMREVVLWRVSVRVSPLLPQVGRYSGCCLKTLVWNGLHAMIITARNKIVMCGIEVFVPCIFY